MAEMNELLEQAIQECEGLAAEADSFGSALGSLDGQVSGDERRILSESREKLNTIQQELANLRQQDAKADASDEELTERLAEGDEILAETEQKARALLEESRTDLQGLRDERERIGAALKEGTDRAREELDGLRERLQELEEAADQRLEQAEDLVGRVEDAVRDAVALLQADAAETQKRIDDAQQTFQELAGTLLTAQDTLGGRAGAAASRSVETMERASALVMNLLGDLLGVSLAEALDEKTGKVSARIEDFCDEAGSKTQLTSVELQDILQKQQQALQMLSNVTKTLHDTALAVVRKIG